jgi:hypothetical protein
MDKKFIDFKKINDWEIETDTGFKPIYSIYKTIPYQIYHLTFEDNITLKCADTHILYDVNYNEVYVNQLKINDVYQTKYGNKKILNISIENEENMYDISVDDSNHRYYTNDVLSKNTDTVCAYLLWCINFNHDFTIGVLANNGKKAREVLGRIKKMFEFLPWWLKGGIIEWNKSNITLSNGSTAFANATTEESLTGYTVNIVYADEFALVENDEEFYVSAFPTISSGTSSKFIITSTPRDLNLFYKLVQDSLSNNNDFVTKIYPWWYHPNRDEEWKESILKNMNYNNEKFRREYECIFSIASETLIDGTALSKLKPTTPIFYNKYFNIYEYPKEDNNYIIIVDSAEGTGKDYSTTIVINVTHKPYNVVFVYRNNEISPLLFSNVVYDTCVKYNNGFLLIESNSIGSLVANELFNTYDYDNMYLSSKFDLDFASDDVTLGVKITYRNKTIGCTVLKTIIENNNLIVNDSTIIEELKSFVRYKKSYRASRHKNDDTVSCLILFSWFSIQQQYEMITEQNFKSYIKDNMTYEPLNFYLDDGA